MLINIIILAHVIYWNRIPTINNPIDKRQERHKKQQAELQKNEMNCI
jgi:hypothetical protein